MTREEATKYARSKKMMLESLIYNDDCKYGNYAMYSDELLFINAVISALRPISREKVEYAVYSAELSFINAVLSALRPVGREQLDVVINSLKLRLENNEENGVVSIPKFAVEQMIKRLEVLCDD